MNSLPRLAAIDIGTNSFHLVVVEADPKTANFKILGREKEVVRLGSGSTDMKYLNAEAIERGIASLKRFKNISDSMNATIRAIATSAVREAKNQNDFIRKAKHETGINIEVASGVEEARYIYLGVLQALPVFDEKILLIDIGGGSTEFLVGHKREIYYDNSLKLGAMRMTQRFFKDKEPDSKDVKDCRKYVKGIMSTVVRELWESDFEKVIGSSGTIMNIANIINLKRGGDEETKLNNFTYRKDELLEVVEEIISAKSIKERKEIPGLDSSRADILAAGAIILEQIFCELKIKEITVSEFALREGIIYDTIEKEFKHIKHDHLSDLRYNSVMKVAENYKLDKKHGLHVAKLSLQLFDQTDLVHKLGYPEREFLEAAAILHECGCFISHTQHHRHSYYLIRNSEMLGFTENEKEIIANIARYHRKSHPKEKHSDFVKLTNEDRIIVSKLAAILRIADGLDRPHKSDCEITSCEIGKDEIKIILSTKDNSSFDLVLWGAEQKKDLFEEVFGMNVKLGI